MTFAHVVILLVTGIVVGFAGGLLGIGGAFIMTPVQYMVFLDMGLPADIAIKLAFGTSLLVVLPTATSGVWRHHRKGVVWWRVAIVMGSCGLVCAFLGATLATHLSGMVLKIAFGVIVLLSGTRMLIAREPRMEQEPVSNPWLWTAWAVPVGLVSGVLGVGGAIVVIPVLVLALKFRMHNAIGISLGVVIFTSIGGVVGYIINGLAVDGLPPYSIGYVNLPSWFLLAVTSIGMAQVGAITAHKLPARQLKYIFIIVMFYIGLRMIGVFEWLGWPI
jgi:uncharacterized membrane protein YfcA